MPKQGKRKKSRPGLGSRKGGSFEREICVKLSLWISNGKSRDLFWRSAMSGGRATIAQRRGIDLSNQAGDLVSIHPKGIQLTGPFFVECKHRKVTYDKFLLFGEGAIRTWWRKAGQQAASHGKIPMMIVRGNGKPTLLIVPHDKLKLYCPDAWAISSVRIPDVHLFDEVMKCSFKKQPLPRYMLKEGIT